VILLNFSHPLSEEQLAQAETITNTAVERVVDINSRIDPSQPLQPQISSIIESIPLNTVEWQTEQLLVNPPSLNYSAIVLLAELHGRTGYFPACLRLRPVPGATPPAFEVAEVLNLQDIRNGSREKRM